MKLVLATAVVFALLQFLVAGLCLRGAIEHWPWWLLLLPTWVGLGVCVVATVWVLVRFD